MYLLMKILKGLFFIIAAWQALGLLSVITWLQNISAVTNQMWVEAGFKVFVMVVCFLLYNFFNKKQKNFAKPEGL